MGGTIKIKASLMFVMDKIYALANPVPTPMHNSEQTVQLLDISLWLAHSKLVFT